MAPRPCIECGALSDGTRCARHRRTRQQRGYDADHDRARAALVARLPLLCQYGCGTLLTHPDELVAAHVVDGRPEHGWLAACRSCNERAKRRG
jgi:hypothetical protein